MKRVALSSVAAILTALASPALAQNLGPTRPPSAPQPTPGPLPAPVAPGPSPSPTPSPNPRGTLPSSSDPFLQGPRAEGPVANEKVARFKLAAYLRSVANGNLDLLAQRASVSLADAQIDLARIFPDPQLTAGLYQLDVTRQGNPTATVVGVNVPLQLGGQRGARIDVAEANLTAAQSDLEDYLRVLRANAANAYVNALLAQLVLDRREQTAEDLAKLVGVNEQRYRVGDVGEALLLQSRVEARQGRAAVIDAQSDVASASLAAVGLLGSSAHLWMDQELTFDGDLKAVADKTFDPKALVARALVTRPDLRAAKRRVNAAERTIDLAKANRVVDVGVGASWQHNFAVNESPNAGLPSSDFVGATVTVPIPFSRLYHGEVNAAYSQQSQAVASERAAEVRVEAEVRDAVNHYRAANARVTLYTAGMLSDADKVLEKTLYNYTRGGATLVEVLVAQHTDNDVYLAYYGALADAAHALIGLEEAGGIWDVDF